MISLFKVAMAPEVTEQVGAVLSSGYIGQGEQVALFEEEFSKLSPPGKSCVAVNSCTSALDTALRLLNVREGDEVITTPMTCTATNSVLVNKGVQIVWADVHPLTGLIDAHDVRKKITPRTKAIMAVDWAGEPPDYRALHSYGIPVIEDAAHRLTAPTPCGDIVCFSFQAIKFLTTGDGGMLCVNSAYRDRAVRLRWYGLERRNVTDQDVVEVGYKYHMNDIAARIGRCNINLALGNARRQRYNAEFYYRYLSHHRRPFQLPHDLIHPTSSYWLFTVLVQNRDEFITEMLARGIECSRVHARNDLLTGYRGRYSGELPGVDYFDKHQVSIPVGWWLTVEELNTVKDAVLSWCR